MAALEKIDDHAMSLRNTRARQILADARAHLVRHVIRDDRVAAALKTARNNVIKFDPIRAFASAREQHVQRQAAAARQRRVQRTLRSAHATLKRIAHIEPASHTTENARVAPEAPSMESLANRFETLRAAVPEAMGELIGDVRLEWRRENDSLRRELDLVRRTLASPRRREA